MPFVGASHLPGSWGAKGRYCAMVCGTKDIQLPQARALAAAAEAADVEMT
jgi:hypothetical protein